MSVSTVYFDIGATLGAPRISPAPRSLTGLEVFSYVSDVLQDLSSNDIGMGIISNTGDDGSEIINPVLNEAGILEFFDSDLLVYSKEIGMKKDSPAVFSKAAALAGSEEAPGDCLYCGEDSQERRFAGEAGMMVSPHPLLVQRVIAGETLRYIRIVAPAEMSESAWRSALRERDVVPLRVTGAEGRVVLAIAGNRVVGELINLLFEIQLLGQPDDPLTTDLFLVRDDLAAESGFLSGDGQSSRFFDDCDDEKCLLSSDHDGLLLAVPAGKSVESFHFSHAHHGHNLKLVPAPSLLKPFGSSDYARGAAFVEVLSEQEAPELSAAQKEVFAQLDSGVIEQHLRRYTGQADFGGVPGLRIASRHIHHPDNQVAVDTLAEDLERIGGGALEVSLHPFPHEGTTFFNVEARLPGEPGEEVVLVTAHLDSTAAFTSPFDAGSDPAPGADDDGSGVAAVLAIAEVFIKLREAGELSRGVRFVLFNAEEHGLVGSQAYAKEAAMGDTAIVALFQMDMIGFNVLEPRSFEVHAGFLPSEETQNRSHELARRIGAVTPEVAPKLDPPQIYLSTGTAPGQRDPAEGRSDHSPFQDHGYAACVTSEDFFAGPLPESPSSEPNPEYHKAGDTFVDPAYAADIARVVGAAAWICATE